jgi:hypothetical protein
MPRPQLVTVPACAQCNSGSSGHDERFRTYLSLHVGNGDQKRAKLFDNALSSLKHNRRLLYRVLSSSHDVPVTTPAGVFVGRGLKVLWDSKAHDSVVERCVRGLFYYHFGSVIGDKAKVKVQWLRRPPFTFAQLQQLTLVVVAKDQFAYRFGRSPDQPLRSVWIFNFYGRHFASAYTEPRVGA